MVESKRAKISGGLKLKAEHDATYDLDRLLYESHNLPAYLSQHHPMEVLDKKFSLGDFISYAVTTAENEDAFYVVNLAQVTSRHLEWARLFPRVKPFYAVKCNPDVAVIRLLAYLGAGFDCASQAEISSVLDCGVDPSRIIFANPCKAAPQLRFAKAANVMTMTFDNAAELHKIHSMLPEADLVLRIYTEDSHSVIPLGAKFGAPIEECPNLLALARQLGLNVVGVSFHVGSGCYSTDAFVAAVKTARSIFDIAEATGHNFTLLDIGGGFPGSNLGTDGISFSSIAEVLNPLLDELFPPSVRIIAEPGRYYVCAAYTLAVSVFGRRRYRLSGTAEPASENLETSKVCNNFFAPDYDMPYTCPSPSSVGTSSASRVSSPVSFDNTTGSSDDGDIDFTSVTDEEYPKISVVATTTTPILPTDESVFYHYSISDGVYGSFKDKLLLNAAFVPKVVQSATSGKSPHVFRSSIFGPTNDSLDCVAQDIFLPELKVGQWLFFEEMGAYTVSLASQFNGFSVPKMKYIWSE
mmetsp:Transcript_26932/g.46415  ORF Transcript_26932/g.46415 Transcript_26932/m.46415 type:complete len:524 (+) Transcript_26932:272-1843(+)|eukprot:CAMPEP_0196655728 /NCGR_PEP_ID=MMETSP1086-20130531/6985_1 /TAXON_ID=77921 /ORGANISM="Cyanoptyche  gloeocystis , Strain SAG4.97" /LENGTH=523 /DNA_ID=CAMNT_0041988191 /DNA_START=151 /DNA_END=1722 /DNA_ORIENTATION=-